MTVTIQEQAGRYVLACDGKAVGYVRPEMLEQLVKREGGLCELWPAQGVLRYERAEPTLLPF